MSKVTYLSLGGSGNVTQNMHVLETEKDIIILDAGIGFPDTDQFGVDVVIPDISYLYPKLKKIKAIMISHAHEDHIGGLPYLIEDLGRPPIYATKLARGFIENKLEEHNRLKNQSMVLVEPEKGPITLGDFTIYPYHVNHSIPDALGYFIKTPIGNIVFSPDFKFDWTPVDNVLFDVAKLTDLAKDGVHTLISDCLGSTREGYTQSERTIQKAFENEISDAKGQVFITTMSSNISRVQQAINASIKYNRRVVPVGRSIERNIEIAGKLGYLNAPDGVVVSMDEARRMKPSKLTYIVAGSFGQKGSSLDRLSRGEHRMVHLKDNAVVIFSADPIPGVYDQVGSVIDNLMARGVRVVYSDIQDDMHVSGHGSKGDLSIMIGLTRPKYFIPIGGQIRHQHGYKDLVEDMGFDPRSVFILTDGQTVQLTQNHAQTGKPIELRDVFVDGRLVGNVGKTILEERMQLGQEGMLGVIVAKHGDKLDSHVQILSKGFVFKPESDELITAVANQAKGIIGKRKVAEWNKVKDELEKKIGSHIYSKVKRRPMVVATLVDA
ncbi:ribonuclease J [candidate division WWE3 bacterium]|uniref:Ribonuclease J n=1 Tax=candidate division WWE3 bacterium TaxID=2053526 RepID=A0A955LJH7_UNCKA|nr:ribonuclease J [candidate division WWE3 bacterium]